jgi:hypothetical protein
MAMSDHEYVSPSLPFSEEAREANRGDFLLDPTWTFLNHGAFGAGLQVGYWRAEGWRRYTERQPLRYFDRDLLPHLADAAREMSRFVRADPRNVAV